MRITHEDCKPWFVYVSQSHVSLVPDTRLVELRIEREIVLQEDCGVGSVVLKEKKNKRTNLFNLL